MKRLVTALMLAAALGGAFATPAPVASAASSISGLGTVHAGMYSSEWDASADLVAMAGWAGKRLTFAGTFHQPFESEGSNWSGNTDHLLEEAWQAQATPVANLSVDASAYAIARGDYDGAIRQWARRVKSWTDRGNGRSLFIAPLQEHNGDWTRYGCDPGNFKGAYQRIRDIVRSEGLGDTKVRWVWAPNGWTSHGCGSLSDYYPGASIVDAIGFSAYRWSQESVQDVTGYVVDELRAFAPDKPYLVLQTAAWPTSSKDQWIRDLFSWAAADANVVGLVWFNFDKRGLPGETDWRVWASPNGPGLSSGWRDGLSSGSTIHTWPLTDWFQAGPLPFTPYPGELSDRIAGSNRYTTANAVSADRFGRNVTIAYVATGNAFPDALAAAAAAGAQGGPVLLVPGSSIDGSTLNELSRLSPDRIVVVGGAAAVSDGVVQTLRGIAPTDRIGGSNRYDTAARIALDAFSRGVPVAYVATGLDFPDALAAAAAAGAQGGPVLLTQPTALPSFTEQALRSLKPKKIVVVGGTAVVSEAVKNQLATIATTTRVAGSNRYDTAAKLAGFVASPRTIYVATGLGFPDALAGAAAAGSLGVPLLLTQPNAVPGPTQTKLAATKPDRVVVLGGTSVISDYVSWKLKQATG